MKKRVRPIIIGNWKTTPATLKEACTFVKQLEKHISSSEKKLANPHYLLAVPDIYVTSLLPLTVHGEIGTQNISGATIGQATGLVTPSMTASTGSTFTLLDHSEVRSRHEGDVTLSTRVALSLKAKLLTVLCIGEEERDPTGKYLAELEERLKETLSQVDRELFNNLILAYEPVWAIGNKEPATAAECFEVIIALRRALASLVGIDHAKKVAILYGGAVTDETAVTFLQEGGADGLLIGRASQEVLSFTTILKRVFARA